MTKIMAARSTVLALTTATVLALATSVALAQQTTQGRPTPAAKSAPQAQPKAAPPAEATAAPSTESGLRLRVEQLEEQLVDMQVVIGTLESMARGGTGGSAATSNRAAPSAQDQARIDSLESQVRSLASQVEQLNQQVRNQASVASVAPSASPPPSPRQTQTTPPTAPGFNTTVKPDRDPIGQIIGGNNVPPSSSPPPAPIPGQASQPTPSLPQAQASDASAKQLYETAYGLLLQQDYAAAETGFDEFLRRFPSDPLAGNAQYWLGETHYVRGQFKPAAASFLKGYQAYGRSSKAPDSLLKLAMSLDRLGQRDAACSSYGELSIKFPNAPGAVKNRADNERRRLGCT